MREQDVGILTLSQAPNMCESSLTHLFLGSRCSGKAKLHSSHAIHHAPLHLQNAPPHNPRAPAEARPLLFCSTFFLPHGLQPLTSQASLISLCMENSDILPSDDRPQPRLPHPSPQGRSTRPSWRPALADGPQPLLAQPAQHPGAGMAQHSRPGH